MRGRGNEERFVESAPSGTDPVLCSAEFTRTKALAPDTGQEFLRGSAN